MNQTNSNAFQRWMDQAAELDEWNQQAVASRGESRESSIPTAQNSQMEPDYDPLESIT